MSYQITWLTDQLGVGHAPMSYTEFDIIKEQGIDAIVNLCGEFCDLHKLEEQSGFEVYYLPIPDECAPDMEAMEEALEWLDEAFYLGKKVLVHCRHGMGRTGTFVSAYMLRRGLAQKITEKKLKGTRAHPTNYQQWRLLRKYGKKEKPLTLQDPTIENRPNTDISPFIKEYHSILAHVNETLQENNQAKRCGREDISCCYDYFELHLIESMYLSECVNMLLTSKERNNIIQKALENVAVINRIRQETPELDLHQLSKQYHHFEKQCPLLENNQCLLYNHQPFRCRSFSMEKTYCQKVDYMLSNLSRNVYFNLVGEFPPSQQVNFSILDTLSGKFVQTYFQLITGRQQL